MAKLWEGSDLNQKQRLQTVIFPEGVKYDGKAYRTPVTARIFKQLHANNSPESHLVAPTDSSLNSVITDLMNIYKLKDLLPDI